MAGGLGCLALALGFLSHSNAASSHFPLHKSALENDHHEQNNVSVRRHLSRSDVKTAPQERQTRGAAFLRQGFRKTTSQCINPPYRSPFDLDLPASSSRITVPAIPEDLTEYTYATDSALVCLPATCLSDAGVSANFKDSCDAEYEDYTDPSAKDTMYLYRRNSSSHSQENLAKWAACAKGWAVVLHGTAGIGWTAETFTSMLCAQGYVVVAPDSQANDLGFKGRRPKYSNLSPNSEYGSTCADWSKPFCYSTEAENIQNDPTKYSEFMERNYEVLKMELDAFIDSSFGKGLIDSFKGKKFFLLGRSEGATVAGRYYHSILDDILSGVIVSGYNCEWSYFQSCPEHAKIQWKSTIPQLNMVGEMDKFFGGPGSESLSMQVEPEYGGVGSISGNCHANYRKWQFSETSTFVMKGAGHDHMLMNGAAYYYSANKAIVNAFLSSPGALQPGSVPSICVATDSSSSRFLYECDNSAKAMPVCGSARVSSGLSGGGVTHGLPWGLSWVVSLCLMWGLF